MAGVRWRKRARWGRKGKGAEGYVEMLKRKSPWNGQFYFWSTCQSKKRCFSNYFSIHMLCILMGGGGGGQGVRYFLTYDQNYPEGGMVRLPNCKNYPGYFLNTIGCGCININK